MIARCVDNRAPRMRSRERIASSAPAVVEGDDPHVFTSPNSAVLDAIPAVPVAPDSDLPALCVKRPPSGLFTSSAAVSAVHAESVEIISPASLAEIEAAIAAGVDGWTDQESAVWESKLHIGHLLLRAKKMMPHGEFEAWADRVLKARRTWRKVLMQLAGAEAYFARARAWAAENGVTVGESARGLIDLVRQYRAAMGEIKASPTKPKKIASDDRLRAAMEEIVRLNQALADASELRAGLSRKNADLLAQCAQMQAAGAALIKKVRAKPRGVDISMFCRALGLDDAGEIVRAVSDAE